ncbi:hypothetical protein QBC44DRAFT_239286 [Cladorrhinum sp. PSN332]|nr:hypothetical protein QBC44DRAFT_239286 [Cladorrhinum sp. PSN332]
MGHNLQTAVNYYDDPGDGSQPTPVYVGSTQVTNERPMLPVPITVTDVTGRESDFTLDTHGFQFHTHKTSIDKDDFLDNDDRIIKTAYYRECEDLLRAITGATTTKAFDHKVRDGPASWHSISSNNTQSRGPLHRAHVDQSYDGAEIRLRQNFPSDGGRHRQAEELVKRRWQIINIWRPLSNAITQSPLALADATTVPDADLLPAGIIYTKTGHRNESWTVKHGPGHKWYFKYRQTPEEITLIKCFDSDTRQTARRTPHCAVEDPDEPPGKSRQSVEVRLLAFY